jgi:hypothetical protein
MSACKVPPKHSSIAKTATFGSCLLAPLEFGGFSLVNLFGTCMLIY